MLTSGPTLTGFGKSSDRPRVVIIGGGIAALEALLTLNDVAGSQVQTTLVSADPRFHFTPLAVAEAFDRDTSYRLGLEAMFADFDVELVVDRLDEVDPDRRRLRTADGSESEYDALLIAIGAARRGVLPGAVTFVGGKGRSELRQVIAQAAAGRVERLVFAVPAEVTWTLPAYELALMAAGRLAEESISIEITVVSPEPRPLDIFGRDPSECVSDILEYSGVAFHSSTPERVEPGRLVTDEAGEIAADVVVALPRLLPAEIAGLPGDEQGFLPVDDRCRVQGLERVYGAGDATSSEIKQGGIAAQQAAVAVHALLADLGLGPEPPPFRPALRGLMIAGPVPRYRRVESVLTGQGESSNEDVDAIPWPHGKVAGRRLAPFLAKRGIPPGAPPGTIAIDIVASVD